MMTIVSESLYPAEIQEKFRHARPFLRSIANRWMMGWPERVRVLIEQGMYWEVLQRQTDLEIEAQVSLPESGMNLAPWEINTLAGIDPAPPGL
jgi:hypothetical protein